MTSTTLDLLNQALDLLDDVAQHHGLTYSTAEGLADDIREALKREAQAGLAADVIAGGLGPLANKLRARCGSKVREGCDKPIIWANVLGLPKPVPIDPRPAVYRVVAVNPPGERMGVTAERVLDCAVTHFATCPRASSFTRNKRAANP